MSQERPALGLTDKNFERLILVLERIADSLEETQGSISELRNCVRYDVHADGFFMVERGES